MLDIFVLIFVAWLLYLAGISLFWITVVAILLLL